MALRYQRQSLYSNERGVMTYEGVDPLTGLPVLIYEFEGVIPRGLENLESENIPGLLDTASEDGKAQAVIAYSRKYQPLAQPLAVTSQTLLLDSARALRDAASAGILHGDIKPERFGVQLITSCSRGLVFLGKTKQALFMLMEKTYSLRLTYTRGRALFSPLPTVN